MMRFSIRKNIKINVVAILCIVFTQAAFGQILQKESPTIGLSFIGNVPKRIEISTNYIAHPDSAGIIAKNSLGYESRVNITYPINGIPSLRFTFGFISGTSTYKFNLKLPQTFASFNDSGYVLPNLMNEMHYFGISIGYRYSLINKSNSSLGINVKLSGIYFFSGWSGISTSNIDSLNNIQLLFKSEMIINENNRILFTPELGLTFSQKLGKRFNLEASMMGVWSKGYIMKTDPNYKIFGDHETLTGTYQKQFKYIGLGLGLTYDLKKVIRTLH